MRYPLVARLLADGFEPWAYGNIDGGVKRDALDPAYPMYRPPSQFGYAAGGLLYPDHADGSALGAIFSVYTQHRIEYDGPGNLEDIAAQPVWTLYDRREWRARALGYGAVNLTLDQAVRLCRAQAAHHRQHYIVPEWAEAPQWFLKMPVLSAAEWRELAALPNPAAKAEPPAVAQMALFAVESVEAPDAWTRRSRDLVALAAGSPDDARIAHPDLIGISDFLQLANNARAATAPPVPTLETVMA